MAKKKDMKADTETYAVDMSLLTWGSIASAAAAVLVIILIAG